MTDVRTAWFGITLSLDYNVKGVGITRLSENTRRFILNCRVTSRHRRILNHHELLHSLQAETLLPTLRLNDGLDPVLAQNEVPAVVAHGRRHLRRVTQAPECGGKESLEVDTSHGVNFVKPSARQAACAANIQDDPDG